MIKNLSFVALLLFFFFLPTKIFAADNSFITIVNPVRISTYVKDPAESLSAEYNEVSKRNLPESWLLTYDVLKNNEMVKRIKGFDQNQELGIFLEVTPNFAKDAGVVYNHRDSWYRATSLFLSGYTQSDRKKLIDKVFDQFKKDFGFYPISVGSWWTDAYSLDYLSTKYHVTGNLSVSDQYGLDNYTVWGTYYSTPYYPSKINAANPASEISNKTDVVMFRWAPRDPLNGYVSPNKTNAAMYSTQDFRSFNLSDDYFEKLATFYAEKQPYNEFGQLTIGLESDFSPESFSHAYAHTLDQVLEINSQILTMKDFSTWYRNKFKEVSPPQLLIADDFLGGSKKAIWYQNPNYRIGFTFDNSNNSLRLVDFRSYYSNLIEPFYLSPNKQNGLQILLPYIIDSSINSGSSVDLPCGFFVSNSQNVVNFEKCRVVFNQNSIQIDGSVAFPKIISNAGIKKVLNGNSFTLYPQNQFSVPQDGIIVEKVGLTIPYTIIRRIPAFMIDVFPYLVPVILAMLFFIIYKGTDLFGAQFFRVGGILFILLVLLLIATRQKLYVSQSESDALNFLKNLPPGKVLVYQKDCIKCKFQTPFEPAAAAGYKNYVGQYSGKKIIESLRLPLAKSPEDIKLELSQSGAKYVYLAKHEDYIEELPYPAETVGLKKLYENANSEILQVTK